MGHRLVGAERPAPVALDEITQPERVLLRCRPVEVVLVLEVPDRLLRDGRPVTQVAQRVAARADQQEDRQRRQQHHGNREEQPAQDVRAHRADF
jgi:hypothetical protein